MTTASSSPTLLQVQQLHIAFPNGSHGQPAVSDISFSIAPGETLGVVGESGSGKSVTALALMRLLQPAQAVRSGQVHWTQPDGTQLDLLQLPENEMRPFRGAQMSMIFQEPMTSLNPIFSCGSQVAEVLKLHRSLSEAEAQKQTLAWFEKVKLPDPQRIYSAYPHQLSGGQRQRVMIAMAMCTSPRLLIADEPTTALDVSVQASILDLIAELRQDTGAAILFISHDLGVIRQLASRVLVMRQGLIVEQGATETVFSQPQHPYTQGLIACRPPLHQQLLRLPVLSQFLPDDGSPVPAPSKQPLSPAMLAERRSLLAQQQPLLDVQDLKVWYPLPKPWWQRSGTNYVKAVDGLSFSIKPGQSVGIVGESGSGKTTVGRSLVGLAPLHSGHIQYKGVDLQRLPSRPRIQMVFQDPFGSLNPAMTIGKALLEPLQLTQPELSQAAAQEEVVQLLQRVGLQAEHLHRYPKAFSGGQRQRIGIARALISKPELLICDESVSALDVSVQAQILNLIKDLQAEQGFALLFISHDLSVINFISDEVLVMHQGVLVESGPPEKIIQNPQQNYTRQLISAIPQ